MTTLALLGGNKSREKLFPKHPIIGQEEKDQVMEVLDSGNISTFIASPGEHFLGGNKIRTFEKNFSEFIGTEYAIAFNSATSALHAAVVAVGVNPGDEVIVPPYSFTSTATCALMHNAIPVFADIQSDIFCLDPESVENNITSLTKAIIPVHLFGHPAEMDKLVSIAKKHDLKIIEDCAQAPGAEYKNHKVGTIGDCGVFSFQETKNMMTGEGGMLVTNDEKIAQIARMIRNHGEMIVSSQKKRTYKSDILGWGYRMTELEAALGIAQLKKLEEYNDTRRNLVKYLTKNLSHIKGIEHTVYDYVKHSYYDFAARYDEKETGIPRELFIKALQAEGIPFGAGYVRPLYLNPIYHEGKPYAYKHYQGDAKYEKGMCPVTESMHEKFLISTSVLRPPATEKDVDDIVFAINKIFENKDELLKFNS